MTTLILPAAGQSSRFPNMRPKWLLTMPCGSLMLEKAFSKLNVDDYSRVVVACLKEHLEKYVDHERFIERIKKNIHQDIELIVLDEPTKSQSETIAACIEFGKINGPIFIKDCDNEFNFSSTGGNEIAVIDLNNMGLIDAKNKSYVQSNELNVVVNIIEKQVISNTFCCGGYGFACAEKFLEHFKKLSAEVSKEIYISHVIYDMILSGEIFMSSTATEYVDWGTKNEYLAYTQKHLTVFCDIDGVLLQNGSAISRNGWNTDPILENINALKSLQERGLLYLIVTTSRPVSEINSTLDQLRSVGLMPDNYVFGLPHSKRYLINDFAPTNPYPSALAINLDRNSDKLKNLFDFSGI